MRTFYPVIAVAVLLLSGTGWAQETDPADDMAEQWTAEQSAREVRQAKLEALMVTMAEEMQTIRSTKNRKERQELMATHRESMREAMGLMRGMGGMHMREVMAKHMGPGKGTSADSNRPRHQHKRAVLARPRAQMSDAQRLADLENRLDMMQVMMESMMEEPSN